MADNRPVKIYKYKISRPGIEGETTLTIAAFSPEDVDAYLNSRIPQFQILEQGEIGQINLLTRGVSQLITNNALEAMKMMAIPDEEYNKYKKLTKKKEAKKQSKKKEVEKK